MPILVLYLVNFVGIFLNTEIFWGVAEAKPFPFVC